MADKNLPDNIYVRAIREVKLSVVKISDIISAFSGSRISAGPDEVFNFMLNKQVHYIS